MARTKAHRVSVPVRPRRAHWQALLEECRQSGLSQAEFCRQRGILPGTLAFWKHTLARETEAGRPRARRARAALPTFLPVRVVAPAPATDTDPVDAAATTIGEIAIQLRGRRHLRIRGRVDLHWLGQVVRTLEGLGC